MDIFDVIADPTRRMILELLRDGPMTAGAIAASFPTSRPGISRHLRQLRSSGAVIVEHEGRTRVYRLRPDWQQPVTQWLVAFDRQHFDSILDAFETEVYRTRRERARDSAPATNEGEYSA